MMITNRFYRILGYIWASPITLLGLIYVTLFTLFGWYSFHSKIGVALIWTVQENRPNWLEKLWNDWAGHAIGNVVVLNGSDLNRMTVTITHESKHVDQCMRLGVFQPIMYVLVMLAIKLGCIGSDSYWSNIFEVDARRYAGQLIDTEGFIAKLKRQRENVKSGDEQL